MPAHPETHLSFELLDSKNNIFTNNNSLNSCIYEDIECEKGSSHFASAETLTSISLNI